MFQRIDVQLDPSMRTAGALEDCILRDYQSEYQRVILSLSDGLEGDSWYRDNRYLCEDRIIVPETGLDGCLQRAHPSSGHTGRRRSVEFFREPFWFRLTCVQLRALMQPIVDSCSCHAIKQTESRDRGLIFSLPVLYSVNSLVYVDFIQGLPRCGGYNSCLVVTCCLTRFTRAFSGNKNITGEQTVKIVVEQ